MTLKQIIISIFIINSITVGTSMTMYHSKCKGYDKHNNRYIYQSDSYRSLENDEIQYFYPHPKRATNVKQYDRDFKKALLKNLQSLESHGASKKALKIYATDGIKILEKNKKRISARSQQ